MTLTQVRYVRPRLYPKQEEAIFCKERYAWIEASTKSGKTHGCIVWLVEQAALRGGPGMNFWWVAPIYSQAKIAYRRLKRSLPANMYRPNEQELSIELLNGAVIWFKTGERPDGLYGEDVYAAVIDEASRIRFDSYVAVRSTLTATRGPIRIIGNVKGKRNWAYRGARAAEKGLKGHRFSRLTAYDAVEGGVFPMEELEDAKRSLPESTFRELYLALPAEDGDAFFRTNRLHIVTEAPPHLRLARGWDFAATEHKEGKDPDWTAGVLLGHTEDHTYIIDVRRAQAGPEKVLRMVTDCSTEDGQDCNVVIEEERGAAGKNLVESYRQHIRNGSGAKVVPAPVTGDKATRAFPLAVRINEGKVSLVHGRWNDEFLAELDEFPPNGGHDDMVDAAAHAFNHLAPQREGARVRWT